ncbi:MAG: hypothetical protein LUH20_13260 [Lachnospiraceae bacterium]|nr:hypothetical protein [Lachnospiraceae bacterium]
MKIVRVSFHMAWRFLRDIPFVLDADTELKVKKYVSCGMKKTAETSIKGDGNDVH